MLVMSIALCMGTSGYAKVAKKVTPSNEENHPYLWETKQISAVEVSPDNKHALVFYYTPQRAFSEQGEVSGRMPTLFLRENYKEILPSAGKTVVIQSCSPPRWTPDSQGLSYLSHEEQAYSLWVLSMRDFKTRKIFETQGAIQILGYQWAPNGKKLALLADTPVPQNIPKVVHDENKENTIKLYVLDVNDKWDASNLTHLASGIAIPKTYRNDYNQSFTWAPDSQHLIYSSCGVSKEAGSDLGQLNLINVETKKSRIIVASEEGTNLFPLASPDGKYIAYVTNFLPGNSKNPIRIYGTDASRVCVIDLKSHEKRCLANTPNENPQLVGWKKDSQSVFVLDRVGNHSQIYELGLDGKSISPFTTGKQALNGVRINSTGESIGYAAGDLTTPAEAYVSPSESFKPAKISFFSENEVKSNVLVENLHWKSKDQKFNLEGVFIHSKKSHFPLPLITILNDYSNTAANLGYVGDLTNYPISILGLIEKGYGVFIPNRRGTDGYGVAFRQAIYQELGGEELQDVLIGIDVLIKERKVDPQKLAVWGWGYGGYLSAWATVKTDRFKTSVVGSGIADLISQMGASSETTILQAIMGGPFWKDWGSWWKKSPISHVKSMNIPTLIQSIRKMENIYQTQSEELLFPLKSRSIPVQMITYLQGEANETIPHATVMAIQDLEVWLEKYLNPRITEEH